MWSRPSEYERVVMCLNNCILPKKWISDSQCLVYFLKRKIPLTKLCKWPTLALASGWVLKKNLDFGLCSRNQSIHKHGWYYQQLLLNNVKGNKRVSCLWKDAETYNQWFIGNQLGTVKWRWQVCCWCITRLVLVMADLKHEAQFRSQVKSGQ